MNRRKFHQSIDGQQKQREYQNYDMLPNQIFHLTLPHRIYQQALKKNLHPSFCDATICYASRSNQTWVSWIGVKKVIMIHDHCIIPDSHSQLCAKSTMHIYAKGGISSVNDLKVWSYHIYGISKWIQRQWWCSGNGIIEQKNSWHLRLDLVLLLNQISLFTFFIQQSNLI